MSTSECSSGCESGWTAYLDQSSNSTYDMYNKSKRSKRVTSQDEDEDLSMVSDASSGPRHDNYHEVRNYSYSVSASKQGNIRKHDTQIKENKGKFTEDCCLDDTASSHVLSFSKASLLHSSPVLFRNKMRKFISSTYNVCTYSDIHVFMYVFFRRIWLFLTTKLPLSKKHKVSQQHTMR